MVKGVCELIGFCLSFLGLIGASTVTGLPMWRVSAFIQENIIVMETRWEGLWMNCYRQANIRMQCKVYDSLLNLPRELQASRGLMCCSVALSFLGLVASIPGLRSISCFPEQPRIKSLLLVIAGSLEIMACLCILISVSWTASSIIQDFYNPLLLDAQRRELGAALYMGWVTVIILFCSGVVFLACQRYEPNTPYQSVYVPSRLKMSYFQPMIPTSSLYSSISHQTSPLAYTVPTAPPAGQAPLYNVPVVYPANMLPVQHHTSLQTSQNSEMISMPINPLQPGTNFPQSSFQSTPPAAGYEAIQPILPLPPMVGNKQKKSGSSQLHSTHSGSGMYI